MGADSSAGNGGPGTVPKLTDDQRRRGMQSITWMALSGQIVGTLTGGVFIVAVLVAYDAPLYVYGLLAALPSLAGVLQVPAAYLVERYRKRKHIAFAAFGGMRLAGLVFALVPILAAPEIGTVLILAAVFAKSLAGAVSGPAWNSMVRDIVPVEGMGDFFARRQRLTVALGIPLSLGAGWFVTWWSQTYPGQELRGYSLLFGLGFLAGLTSLYFIKRTPEPAMPPVEEKTRFIDVLTVPFRDTNFRHLMQFLGSWGFALAIASPFFTVYLLSRLGYPMSTVIVLTVLSQIANLVFVRIWGRLVDRFSNKAVLNVSGPLVLGTTALWLFTATPEPHQFTLWLLVVIHVIRGMSMAGVSLATGNIALRLAPEGRGAPYLAANSLVGAIAGFAAPLIGGAVAGGLEGYQFSIQVVLEAPGGSTVVPAFDLQGMDFVFLLATVVGFYAMHRLSFVSEGEAVDRSVVVRNLFEEIKRPVVTFSDGDQSAAIGLPISALRRTRRQFGRFSGVVSGGDRFRFR
jgi:MFS family permease